MAKYQWDINDIRKRLLNCQKSYIASNYTDYNSYESIDVYENMLSIYNLKKQSISISDTFSPSVFETKDDTVLQDDFDYLCHTVYPDIRTVNFKLCEVLLKPINLVTSSTNYDKDSTISGLAFSNDDLLMIIDSFYKSIGDKTIYDKFKNISNPKKHLINIQYLKENPYNYQGLAFKSFDDNSQYCNIVRSNTTRDFETAAHEIMHMIIESMNIKNSTVDTDHYYLDEIEGFFCNMIFEKFMSDRDLFKDDVEFFGVIDYYTYADALLELYIGTSLLESSIESKKIRWNKFNKKLISEGMNFEVDKDNFKEYISSDSRSLMRFTTSYLSALDLYYLYLTDREKAIYIIKNIKNYDSNNIFTILENSEIHFFEDNYSNLNKHVKSLIKKGDGSIG